MKQILSIATITLSLITSAQAASYPTNLEGTYDCNVTEINGKDTSKGVATLTKTGETYELKSEFDDASYLGIGIYDQKSHILAIGSINPKNEKETGVTVAHIKKNGHLTTEWTYLNNTNVGHSTCTKRTKA